MKNITLKKYTRLPDTFEYDVLLEHLNPHNIFAGKQMDIYKMPYANVKYCIRLLSKIDNWDGIIQLFSICFGVDEKAFWNVRVVEYFAARKFIISAFEKTIENEVKVLSSINTDSNLWQMAGANKLNPYGDTLPLIQLGKLFGQYPFDLGRKPYSEIFSLLVQVKVQNEVENEYTRLASRK